MFDYSGIEYRLWAVSGVFLLLGILGFIIVYWKQSQKVDGLRTSSALMIFLGIVSGIWYIYVIGTPNIQMICGSLNSVSRNSRVAPPLPLTMEYTFVDNNGMSHGLYLDVLSKKRIIPGDFEEGNFYMVWYEDMTDIIIKVECINPTDISDE